jgi:hypothetical protein
VRSVEKLSDKAPHAIAFWIKWENHQRLSNGQLSPVCKDSKEYRGVINFEDRETANEEIVKIITNLKEEFNKCQLREQQKKNN